MNETMEYIINNMGELIASLDINFNYTSFNKRYSDEFLKIFGKSIEIGDNMLEKLEHLPEEKQNAYEIWNRAINGEEFSVIKEFGDVNKERNAYELTYSSIRDEDGNITGAFHILRDVSIREMMKEKAKSADKIKRIFLTNMSHELRTPLNAVMGYTQLIKYDNKRVNVEKYAENILSSSNYLLSLINDTLDVSRFEKGTVQFSIEKVRIDYLFSGIINDMTHLANDSNIEISFNIQKYKKLCILTDSQRAKQILINLISNAIKYNKKNGQVNIEITVAEEILKIHVRDTGTGISEENILKIGNMFERFGKEGSNITGTGLGLSITKMLCELLNVSFNVNSIIDEGSTFIIGFPLIFFDKNERDDNSEESSNDYLVEDTNTCETLHDKISIYYIDDNEFNLFFMKSIIEQFIPNCSYGSSQDPIDGLKKIKSMKNDIIILDINMDKKNGLEILKEAKELNNFKYTKFMILTADSSENIKKMCKKTGSDDFMNKPVIIPVFLEKIKNLIKK
jgi:signal transduction histidine kinase/CheY-like chemotaxis protein